MPRPERADRRPPHLVYRQFLELIFHPVQRLAEAERRESAEHPQHQVERQRVRQAEVDRAHLEHRAAAHQPEMHAGGDAAGDHQRNERPRLEFEQQQLDGENHAGDGSAEGGGHAGSGSAGQQHFALGGGGVQQLADQRSHGAAGLDDGAFGAERSAGADGDGRRDRLQDRDLGLDAAAVDQHRFHGFGNAVAANLVAAVTRHDADDHAADHRSDDHPQAEMIVARAGEGEREAMEEEDVGEQPDQVVEQKGDDAREESDEGGEQRDQRGAEAHLSSSLHRRLASQRRVHAVYAQGGSAFAHRSCLRRGARSWQQRAWPAAGCSARHAAKRGNQRGGRRAEFLTMMQGELAQHLLATRSEADVNLAPVFGAAVALDQVFFLQAADQLHRAVMLNLQALSEIGNAGAIAAACPAYGQHELMVLRLDARLAGCLLAEMQKAADLVAKLGQRRVVGLLEIIGTHVKTIISYNDIIFESMDSLHLLDDLHRTFGASTSFRRAAWTT